MDDLVVDKVVSLLPCFSPTHIIAVLRLFGSQLLLAHHSVSCKAVHESSPLMPKREATRSSASAVLDAAKSPHKVPSSFSSDLIVRLSIQRLSIFILMR